MGNVRRMVQARRGEARRGRQDYACERACGWRRSQGLFQCLIIKAYRVIISKRE